MTMHSKGLAKLLEELGELSQVAAKKLTCMNTDEHPDGAGSLAQRLEDEAADVLASIDFVTVTLGLDRQRIEDRRTVKHARFIAWHDDPNA